MLTYFAIGLALALVTWPIVPKIFPPMLAVERLLIFVLLIVLYPAVIIGIFLLGLWVLAPE